MRCAAAAARRVALDGGGAAFGARFRRSFVDVDIAIASFPSILVGLWVNIQVLFVAAFAVAILGTTLAVLRSLRGPVFFPLQALATVYTDLFRGVPLLIVLYLVGFGVPALGIFGRVPVVLWGTIAIVLTYSAYVNEVLRAGMEAVHPLAAGRRPLDGPHARADAAHRRHPAGRP